MSNNNVEVTIVRAVVILINSSSPFEFKPFTNKL
jgi:hypothetical protein